VASDLSGKTVLVLAPADGWGEDIARALGAAGAQVVTANDAGEAIAAIDAAPVDAIVFDEHRLGTAAQEVERALAARSDERREAPLISIDDRDREDADNGELAAVVVDSVASMIAMRWN
jgi:NAD(P)-dependent dehydrogenase (short-subunit alcohol dehydrogenase family)